jgi:hypothetical protein
LLRFPSDPTLVEPFAGRVYPTVDALLADVLETTVRADGAQVQVLPGERLALVTVPDGSDPLLEHVWLVRVGGRAGASTVEGITAGVRCGGVHGIAFEPGAAPRRFECRTDGMYPPIPLVADE